MAGTFFALLKLADLSDSKKSKKVITELPEHDKESDSPKISSDSDIRIPSFHYNIQIHLPATKDVEVYNSIFKSLKQHFVS